MNTPIVKDSPGITAMLNQMNEKKFPNLTTPPPSSYSNTSVPTNSTLNSNSLPSKTPQSINTDTTSSTINIAENFLSPSSSNPTLFSPPQGEAFLREKEKQILKLYDQNTEQLSAMVVERDNMLLSAAQAMNILKKDFSHNLALLKNREEEIKRLEKEKKDLLEKFEFYENEINNLSERCSELINKELKRNENIEQEKMMNKVRKFSLFFHFLLFLWHSL